MKIIDFLLPTDKNNHSPHILQKVAMTLMVGLVFISFATANLQAIWWQSSDWLVGAVLPATVVDLTNKERVNSHLIDLKRSAKLDEAAQLKAEHMAKYGYFSHYSPEGLSPWYWFDTVSYKYVNAGENLAIHFSDSKSVVDAWMKSPSHKANIMNGQFTEIGIGIAKGVYDGYQTVFVVQLFGTPNSDFTLPSVTNSVTKMSPKEQLASVATRPQLSLQIMYLVLGAIVVFSLFTSVLLGIYRGHFRQVTYGVFLLFLMSGLFFLHSSLTDGVLISSYQYHETTQQTI